jgi:hypothetical protein
MGLWEIFSGARRADMPGACARPQVSVAGLVSVVLPFSLLAFAAIGRAQPARAAAPRPPDGPGGELIARSLPRVTYRGGPYLRRPRVVTVTFAGDDPVLVSRLERFGSLITRTGWWREVTEGYCVRSDCIRQGRPGAGVRLRSALPARVRDADIEMLLAREVEAGRIKPLDADTLLLAYLPAGVALSDAFHPLYCGGGPRAFHRALKLGESKIPFAVLPRCGGEAELTATASHEILEAATNPDPSARGFAFERAAANAGFTAAGVEPVDPCGLLTIGKHQTLESGFVVQRAWSNRQASLGRDPCVPSRTGGSYVALVPRHPAVRLTQEVGSLTVTLDAVADRQAPAWAVSALDLTGGQGQEPCVEVVLDKSAVVSGQTATLTIRARRRDSRRLCVVGVVSTLGDYSYTWPLAVITR